MDVTLSVYGTVYNSHKTVEAVIKNIFDTFSEIKNNIEVVIVDNYSDDGTYEIIKKMQENYNILLYRKQCTRGEGRNFAFSKTTGKYVLNRDFDDVYIDKTMYILLTKFNDYLEKNTIINEMSKREVIENIGNWSNLNAGEDVELKARAIKNNVRTFSIPAVTGMNYNVFEKKSSTGKTLLNENRYTKGKIKYIERSARWLRDTTLGYGIKLSDFKNFSADYKFAFLFGIIFTKMSGKYVDTRYYKEYNNIDIMELKKEYLNPELFNIPKERWITTINNNIDKKILGEKIKILNGYGFKNTLISGSNMILSYYKTLPPYINP